uniref:HEAT repeat domain-containing protein n=1 Tax=Schlesneria paludicola TaxID=360056 RepID=A0A7C4QNT0_9PLAN
MPQRRPVFLVVFLVASAVVIAGAALVILLEPSGVLRGRLTGETFYRGRPASAWRQQLSGGPAVQAEAEAVLAHPEAVPVLRNILSGTGSHGADAEARWIAARLLAKLGPDARSAEPELLAALRDADPHLPGVVAAALPKVGIAADQALPALVPLLETPHAAIALRAISEYRAAAKTTLPALMAVLSDRTRDSEVRWNAARTLGKIGPDAAPAVATLVEHLTDDDPLVREHAAEALGDIGPAAVDAVPALVAALRDPQTRVRRDAVRSLGQIGPVAREAEPAVRRLLADKEAMVRTAAATAWERITGEDVSTLPADALAPHHE